MYLHLYSTYEQYSNNNIYTTTPNILTVTFPVGDYMDVYNKEYACIIYIRVYNVFHGLGAETNRNVLIIDIV